MSAPEPRSVNVPLLKLEDPPCPVTPTSWFCHGLGSVDAPPVVANDSVSDVAVMFANVRDTTFQKYVAPPASGVCGVHEYVSGGFTSSDASTVATRAMFPALVPR